jgi:hypothetical protein
MRGCRLALAQTIVWGNLLKKQIEQMLIVWSVL